MSNITTYASHFVLNFILGRQPTVVTSLFRIALSTQPLGNEGINLTEPIDPAYSRVVILNNRTNLSIALNKITTIITEHIFDESTVDWGILTHFAIFDDSDNIWFYGQLQNSLDAEAETSVFLPADFNMFRFDICGVSTSDMAITTLAANSINNHFLGRSPILSPPPIYYVGVSTTPINTEGIGATEPWGASEYQRLVIPNDKNSFTMASNRRVSNALEFKFNQAQVPWHNQTHYIISDAPTGGNIWWSGKLIRGRNVEIATTLIVKRGGFTWRLDTCLDLVSANIPMATPSIMGKNMINTFWGIKQ